MKDFIVNDKSYILDESLRNWLKPDWGVMVQPARGRLGGDINLASFAQAVALAEGFLNDSNETLVGKNILEVGCNEGARSLIMARYQDTRVHGIDVDEYTVNQSPDMNDWNPNDVKYVHDKFEEMRLGLYHKFPRSVANKVTFETADISKFDIRDRDWDTIISWDTLEHILDLPNAFKNMYDSLIPNGVMYHEYNPFFAINGGHSLCTLDFLYGHCRLAPQDFERYIKEYRPNEVKVALNFYYKCLNRATIADMKKHIINNNFDIISWKGMTSFTEHHAMWRNKMEKEFLPEVVKLHPTATIDDLFYSSIQFVARKK